MRLVEREDIRQNLAELPGDAATLARLLTERFSSRAFLPQSVPRQTIEQMLAIANMAPSWCNSQPWEVIVTAGEGTERFRTALFDRAQADAAPGVLATQTDLPLPSYSGVYKERQRAVGWQLYEAVGVANGDRAASARQSLENFRLFGAPHALILTSPRDLGTYGNIDCGLFIGVLTLAAQSLGLGLIPQAALAMYSPLVREHFGIAADRDIVIGASLGLADQGHRANSFRSRRSPVGDVVRWVDA